MKTFFNVFIGVFMFVSCASSDSQIEGRLITNATLYNPMEFVGEDHNFILNDIMIKWNREDSKDEKIKKVKDYFDLKLFNKNIAEKFNLYGFEGDISDFNLNNLVENQDLYKDPRQLYKALIFEFCSIEDVMLNFDSKLVSSELLDVIHFLETCDANLFKMLEEIDHRESLVDFEFREKNSEIIYSFFATLKFSLKFWAPINEGGEGRVQRYYDEFEGDQEELNDRIVWWKVAACDAVGAAVGAILGGGKGALVTSLGASSISIIMQW